MNFKLASRWLIWVVFFLLAATYVASSAKLTSDMRQFIPGEDPNLMQAINHGPNSKLLLISLSNGLPQDMAKLNHELGYALQVNDYFTHIINGSENTDNQLPGFLFKHRYLLFPSSANDFTSESITAALKQRLTEIRSSFSTFPREYLQSDPTGLTVALLKNIRRDTGGIKRLHNTLFTDDEKNSLLFVWLKYGASDIDKQEQAIHYIRNTFNELNQTDIAIRISGLPSIAVAYRHQIKTDAQQLTMFGSLFIFIFVLFLYRSLMVAFLIAVPLGSGVLAGTLAVLLLYGEIHGITLAFGITLLGIAIDYPIHVFTHKTSTIQDRNTVFHTIYMGAITTIIGFLSLVFSGFSGLQQLGAFACSGLLTAVFVTRYLLTDKPVKSIIPITQILASNLFNRLSGFKHDKSLLILITIASGIFIGINHDDYLQTDIRNYGVANKENPTVIDINDTGRLMLIEGDKANTVLILSEMISLKLDILIQDNILQSYAAPSDYIPSTRQQQKNLAALPERSQLDESLRVAIEATPFKKDAFLPFAEAVERAKQHKALDFEDFRHTALYTRTNQRLYQSDGNWVGLINLSGISDEGALINIAEEYGSQVNYINVSTDSSAAILTYQQEMIVLCFLGLGVIILVLIFRLGVQNAAVTLLPIFAALSLTLVLLFMLGHKLTIFHIASLLLVLGLSLDYSLFCQRPELNDASGTSTSLLVCSLSTAGIFALLASSSILALNAIGTTVLIGSLVGFFFSVLAANVRGRQPSAETF